MNAKRARGRLIMEAWRFTTKRLNASRLDRLTLRDAAEAALFEHRRAGIDMPAELSRLRAAALAIADTGEKKPLTDEHVFALEMALDLAAKAAKATEGIPADRSSPAEVDTPSGAVPSPHFYYQEGQYA